MCVFWEGETIHSCIQRLFPSMATPAPNPADIAQATTLEGLAPGGPALTDRPEEGPNTTALIADFFEDLLKPGAKD